MHLDAKETLRRQNTILLVIIGAMLVINAYLFKTIISMSDQAIVEIQVPQILEPGKYVIGSDNASDLVYKTWGKIWVDLLSNYSYEDVRDRANAFIDYLDPKTAFKNKKKLADFVNFVEENFVSQSFQIKGIKVQRLRGTNKVKILAYGKALRKIGDKTDPLSGLFEYEVIAHTFNGQPYIDSFKMLVPSKKEKTKARKDNKYVNFKSGVQK